MDSSCIAAARKALGQLIPTAEPNVSERARVDAGAPLRASRARPHTEAMLNMLKKSHIKPDVLVCHQLCGEQMYGA